MKHEKLLSIYDIEKAMDDSWEAGRSLDSETIIRILEEIVKKRFEEQQARKCDRCWPSHCTCWAGVR